MASRKPPYRLASSAWVRKMTGHRKRPRDPAQLAKLIVDNATGEVADIEPEGKKKDPAAVERGRSGGLKGGKANSILLSTAPRRSLSTGVKLTHYPRASALDSPIKRKSCAR